MRVSPTVPWTVPKCKQTILGDNYFKYLYYSHLIFQIGQEFTVSEIITIAVVAALLLVAAIFGVLLVWSGLEAPRMKPTSLFSLITINAMLRSTRNSRILTTPWSDSRLPIPARSRLGSNLIETQLSTVFPLASFFSSQDRCGLELKHCSPVMTV